jgi:diguanylate cyclase (GGDEF)-like protein
MSGLEMNMRDAIRKVISLDFGFARASVDEAESALPTAEAETLGVGLIATRDKASHQWAARWLNHIGLEARLTTCADEALGIASATRSKVMIVDGCLENRDGEALIRSLRRKHGDDVPVIALCATDSEVALATDLGVTDVVRRPFDWQVIAHRVRAAIEAHENLSKLRFASIELERLHDSVQRVDRERRKAEKLDDVTGLPSGERFRKLLQRAIGSQRSSDATIGVAVIGLNQFRTVNEAVGFDNANVLIAKFAERMRSCLNDRQIVGNTRSGVSAALAHLGGARFAIMLADAAENDIRHLYNCLRERLQTPFEVDGQSVYLDAALGAAIYPSDASGADRLLHNAESAMLEAQEHAVGMRFYCESDGTSSHRLLNLDSMLREAIRNDDLELAYQPIICTRSNETVGAEALLRWNHAEEGAISPADFVPVAEKNGLMHAIGEFVIEKACAQLRDWLDQGVEPLRMAVNISLCQLLAGDIIEVVDRALRAHGINPQYLELELSERGVLNQHPEVIEVVRSLKAMGVRISIDDFGTGQSAIGYLVDLPVDVIKIDRSYVSGANCNARNEAIASGMVALAQRLDATVIAEGVETAEQLEQLRLWGADLCQGFYFSPAVSPDEFVQMLGNPHDAATPVVA